MLLLLLVPTRTDRISWGLCVYRMRQHKFITSRVAFETPLRLGCFGAQYGASTGHLPSSPGAYSSARALYGSLLAVAYTRAAFSRQLFRGARQFSCTNDQFSPLPFCQCQWLYQIMKSKLKLNNSPLAYGLADEESSYSGLAVVNRSPTRYKVAAPAEELSKIRAATGRACNYTTMAPPAAVSHVT